MNLMEDIKNNIRDLLQEPRIVNFFYQTLILGTGILILYILSNDNYPLEKTIMVMLAWFILIILFPVPDKIASNIDPFNEEIEELGNI